MDSYHVVVSHLSSKEEYFPGNKVDDFRVKFSNPLRLACCNASKWKVALCEIHLTIISENAKAATPENVNAKTAENVEGEKSENEQAGTVENVQVETPENVKVGTLPAYYLVELYGCEGLIIDGVVTRALRCFSRKEQTSIEFVHWHYFPVNISQVDTIGVCVKAVDVSGTVLELDLKDNSNISITLHFRRFLLPYRR